MATGYNTYNPDILTLVNDIYEGALFTLRQNNLLVATVKVFHSTGMAPRKTTKYGVGNFREVAETDDVTPTEVDRALLTTLTPARYADNLPLTDIRVATDPQDVRGDFAMIMGQDAAQTVDEKVATHFGSLTGGTIGAAGSALTWANIMNARSIMQTNKIPGPYWCALHPYGWVDLVNASLTSGNAIMDAPMFRDDLIKQYFVSKIAGDVTFVITSAIAIDSSDDAVGAMYSSMALAYDERKPFNIRPQRDESREATELNSSLWFATGTWDPSRGVKITHDATQPTT